MIGSSIEGNNTNIAYLNNTRAFDFTDSKIYLNNTFITYLINDTAIVARNNDSFYDSLYLVNSSCFRS